MISIFIIGVFQTLPPIQKTATTDEEKIKERQQRKFEQLFWQKPEPPAPFLLHLGVTTRTHDITEFQANFPTQTKNFYIDRYTVVLVTLHQMSDWLLEFKNIVIIIDIYDIINRQDAHTRTQASTHAHTHTLTHTFYIYSISTGIVLVHLN